MSRSPHPVRFRAFAGCLLVAGPCLALGLLLAAPARAVAQTDAATRAAWNRPVEPFRIIGSVYYVGVAGVSAFYIATPDGGILLDGGLEETAPLIVANLAALGFRIEDVRFLLNSHAHFDHAGGLAELVRRSGATMVASERDAPVLERGGPLQPKVVVGRRVADGDVVSLGGVTLTANVTPGHTKGCTSWSMTTTEGGRDHRVYFHCSTSVVDRLVGNAAYPGIVADYEQTFARLKAFRADVFLGSHPSFFDLAGKRARMKAAQGGPNPFVDPAEIGEYLARSERAFRDALARERGGG